MEICLKIDQSPNGDDIGSALKTIINNQTLIMSGIDDLKNQVAGLQTQVTELQSTLDAEQAQIAELLSLNAQVVTGLNEQIASLQAQIAAGATPEQLQEIANGLTAISDGIATVRTDLEGTVSAPNPNPEQPGL
jgi:predicted  nucleic acid-binding Zn-ribbon protein